MLPRLLATVVLTATVLAATAASASAFQWFRTPSGKIQCVYVRSSETGRASIRCDLLFVDDRAIVLDEGRRARKVKVTDTIARRGAKVLRYGTSRRYGHFNCTSRRSGLTCRDRRSGHGFTAGTERQRLY